MSLSQELQRVTSQMAAQLTPEQTELLESFIADLKESLPLQRPLQVGDEMEPFVLPDALGREVSSIDLLVRGPLVIVFYRGSWCPWCNLQLKAIQDALDDIHELGAELVAISPMTPDNSLSFSEKKGLTYPVLSDVGLNVARTFGLVYPLNEAMQAFHQAAGIDLVALNGNSDWELPMPATYIIDNGVVVARVNPDWRERMDPLEVVAALQKLGKGS